MLGFFIVNCFLISLNRRQEEITSEREEIDRQKKMLVKKRPSNSETGGRKRASSQSGTGSSTSSTNSVPINSTPSVSTPPITLPSTSINNNQVTGATTGTVLHNGTVAPSSALDTATFLKPEAVPGLSWQEYYEADEILKVNIKVPY